MEFVVPSRGLIGFRGDFIRATRGEGIMSHSFYGVPARCMGDFDTRRNGVLISFEEGTATFYALKNAEDRGQFFISPGTKVYKGMIIGEIQPAPGPRDQRLQDQAAHQHAFRGR